MEKIYHNPKHPAAFGGVRALQKAGNFKNAKEYLLKNKTYRKFKQSKRKFQRARIFVSSMAHIFQADLMDMQKFSRKNQGYRYILILVDVFSRFLVAKPLKNKSADEVATALDEAFNYLKGDDLLAEYVMLGTDLGTEFWNTKTELIKEKYNIAHFPLRAPKKASLAEITGRYLIERIRKYMFANETEKWIDKLDDFVQARNSRKTKSLGNYAPKDVNYNNQAEVYETLYSDRFDRHKRKPLEIGAKVQIALERLPFHKSYHGYFSDKVYIVKHKNDYNGIFRYKIADSEDNIEIMGTYYADELLELTD
jgi:hypothetical protein